MKKILKMLFSATSKSLSTTLSNCLSQNYTRNEWRRSPFKKRAEIQNLEEEEEIPLNRVSVGSENESLATGPVTLCSQTNGKTTLETSGEDVKTTLVTSGKIIFQILYTWFQTVVRFSIFTEKMTDFRF